MIHYHGTPIGCKSIDVVRFLSGRHALIPFPRQDDLEVAREVCQSYCVDNGAFSIWKRGGKLDVDGYRAWVDSLKTDQSFDFALAPDCIDGGEAENDAMLDGWEDCVPVFHLHESVDRLVRLASSYPMVAFGSSGQYSTPGSSSWWQRMAVLMDAITVCGKPICKLHGLRMLDVNIFTHLPFRSADSTNVAQNSSGMSFVQQAETIARRIESHQSPVKWTHYGIQEGLAI